MPNWCSNKLEVTGPADQIASLAVLIEDGFSFSKVVPPPNDPAYRDEPSQQEARASKNWWYSWNVNNWGTKWDIEEEAEISSDSIKAWFDTAWSPPVKFIETAQKLYPDLTFSLYFSEMGANYHGSVSIGPDGMVECFDGETPFWPEDADWDGDEEPELNPKIQDFLNLHGIGMGG